MLATENNSLKKTTEQTRAKHAFKTANSRRGKKEYKQKVQGMAPDILNNGLLQTLAIYYTDSKEKLIVEDIQKWLFSEECNFGWGIEKKDTIIESLCECRSDVYRRAQVETLAYLIWLKRFTKANGGDQ